MDVGTLIAAGVQLIVEVKGYEQLQRCFLTSPLILLLPLIVSQTIFAPRVLCFGCTHDAVSKHVFNA